MHGISNSFIASNASRKTYQDGAKPPLARAIVDSFSGMRNLIPLRESNAFGQSLGRNQDLRVLMRKLAARIGREKPWPDVLSGAADAADNPRIPSGYTYLLQLIAHDLVNTSISLSTAQGDEYGVHNSRVQALSLDTIFGGGPDVCPHAYARSEACAAQSGNVPRTRLRVGRSRAGAGLPAQPGNDIGRAISIGVQNDVAPESKSINEALLTEALVADARNDDHALISQLTLLWHRLHNCIIDKIEPKVSGQSAAEKAYHAFILSRFVVTFIYRKIILYDVLGKLLHPIAFKYYVLDGKSRVTDNASGIPVEFAHGAFRCGHAMVRDSYFIRGEADQERETNQALMFSAQRVPKFMPVSETWVIDWKRFFQTEGSAAKINHSRRLGPNFSGVLKSELFFRALTSGLDGTPDLPGLHSRDLVSSAFANMWSVPALIDELRSRSTELANFLPPYSDYVAPLTTWLEATSMGIGPQLDSGDVAAITKDPPLPFFTLFEAALGDRRGPLFKGGGQFLGPLGSVVVAETILGAMSQHPLSVGEKHLDTQKSFAEAASVLEPLGLDKDVARDIPEIRSMPELLTFMRSVGATP
ncbi:animal heme peroxidase [Variibacter gotjawalensis]|uniref:Animal heme peroxidase n=1 Tax=Variibacter gotjawalensis TaxID=1333996 RepID=A0A0S3PZU5_9BRAD|nr:peroxidase family protein [Variibacter gotjawalensis]NIK47308.1 hypothetical protein [Variibacter gotjawalensis]RZS49206.1 heme peroxidase [Variibacter gotjawalensis]BAT61468.1 animal heme peroxidase [Variibacter gotjawalensis]